MDVKKSCSAVIGRVIFIGFCIQIVLGIFWMCNAFAGMKSFGEGIVCVGQILLLGGVLWLNLPQMSVAGKCFAVLAVESFPMILQFLMKPDLRIGGVLIFLTGWKVCRTRVPFAWLLAGLGIVIFYAAGPRVDLLSLSGSRIAWTTLYQDYGMLEEEDKGKVGYDVVVNSMLEAAGVETVLVPALREKYPEPEVKRLMGLLMERAWNKYKSRILKEVFWDEMGYLFPALVVPLQLRHRAYDSYTGLNYRQFLQPCPRIGSYAMRYGCCWFWAACLLRMIMWGMNGCHIGKLSILLYGAFTTIGLSIWYTFSTAGKMDYKNSVYILCLCFLWMTDAVTFGKGDAADVV